MTRPIYATKAEVEHMKAQTRAKAIESKRDLVRNGLSAATDIVRPGDQVRALRGSAIGTYQGRIGTVIVVRWGT